MWTVTINVTDIAGYDADTFTGDLVHAAADRRSSR